MHNTLQRTWAEIDMDALAHNYKILRAHVGEDVGFLGVVKADGYGHGAVRIASKLQQLGATYLGVSNIEEAIELRSNGVTMDILLLGYTPANMTRDLIEAGIIQDVPSLDIARAYNQEAASCGKRLRVHLKLDTGMGRLGFPCDSRQFDQSLQALLEVLSLEYLDCEGIFTHFSVADEPENPDHVAYTHGQYAAFRAMVDALETQSGHRFQYHHCCNSGGVGFYPQYAWDMCRPGLLLYGVEMEGGNLGLRPVMTLKTAVGAVKTHGAGDCISYGRAYETTGEERLGTVPIGYADGLQRRLSQTWRFWTPGGNVPIRGKICMDMCMVDLTDLPEVTSGDELEVFGTHNTVADMARLADTIPYELICGISKRVPRIYLEGGVAVDRNLQLLF